MSKRKKKDMRVLMHELKASIFSSSDYYFCIERHGDLDYIVISSMVNLFTGTFLEQISEALADSEYIWFISNVIALGHVRVPKIFICQYL